MPNHLADNVIAFARMIRRAGLPVGPADMLAAQRALTLIDLGDRGQVRAGLRATMVHRHEQAEIFDQAFALFWRDPSGDGLGVPQEGDAQPDKAPPGARRLAEAMAGPKPREAPKDEPPKIDAVLTVSETEKLQTMDFEAMSADEIAAAKADIRRLILPLRDVTTRRWHADARGPAVDLRATLRTSLRQGGEIVKLSRASRVTRPPPLVVLVDISGSMSRYAQILLHFVHAVANDRDRVSVFLFGTRLTNITRALRDRDPEVAFQMVTQLVPDWSGGTRIGETLEKFNRIWARRVLGQGAVVLLVTDGLDREGARGLDAAMDRLHRSCRRLIWLNPLLRWSGFEPKSQGIKAMLPHVDEFRPVHNLASLRSLIESLSRPATRRT
jgi:uncharacterized protein with von Willebrand factor type A (vWA) domain